MPANHTRHQNRETTVFKCENRKTNQKSAKSKTSAEGYHLYGDGYTDRVVCLDSKQQASVCYSGGKGEKVTTRTLLTSYNHI